MDPLTQTPEEASQPQPQARQEAQPIMTPPVATMQEQPITPQAAASMPSKSTSAKKTSFGPLIGAAIIIAILIAGAFYFWSPLLMPDAEQSTALYNHTSMTGTSVATDTQVSAAAASIDALQSGIDQDMNALNQNI
jgi:uncharacterized protein HemX